LCKAEEDLRLLRQQLKANVISSESQSLGAPDPRSSTNSHLTESIRRRVTPARDSVSSNFTASSGPSDVRSQLLQVLREAAGQGTGYGNRNTQLTEDYPDGHTVRTFYMSLADPWSIIPPDSGPVKEYYKVKDANQDKFSGDRLSYPVWRRRFIATVHSQRMLIWDKALALSTALDRKNETLGAMIGGLHYDPTTYAGLIAELERLYGGVRS
jgi:hypothetical protein